MPKPKRIPHKTVPIVMQGRRIGYGLYNADGTCRIIIENVRSEYETKELPEGSRVFDLAPEA